jgi:cell division protein ZapA
MATVEIEIGGRRYMVACRDGEEPHFRSVADLVDQKAQDAAAALGSLSETRQLLFASLLLADELKERRSAREGSGGAEAGAAGTDEVAAPALERLAERMERLADTLEGGGANPYMDI